MLKLALKNSWLHAEIDASEILFDLRSLLWLNLATAQRRHHRLNLVVHGGLLGNVLCLQGWVLLQLSIDLFQHLSRLILILNELPWSDITRKVCLHIWLLLHIGLFWLLFVFLVFFSIGFFRSAGLWKGHIIPLSAILTVWIVVNSGGLSGRGGPLLQGLLQNSLVLQLLLLFLHWNVVHHL